MADVLENQDQINIYLDGLRESAVVNMFGAWEYVAEEFDLDRRQAQKAVKSWMETFAERHGDGE